MKQSRADRTPVLIAGAGPSGLAAAAELAHQGIDSVVIEPRAEISYARPRAKTTSVRTMEHMRRWGVAGALRSAAPIPPSWSQRVTFCDSLLGARVTDIDGAFGLVARRDDRFAESGQQVAQPVVEQVLRQHLAREPTVDFRAGQAVVGAIQRADEVVVRVRDEAGQASMISARHVLACDGPNSVLRDQIGAKLVGQSDSRPNFNVVFRAPGLDTDLGPAVQYWVLGAQTPGVLGRMDLRGTWWASLPSVQAEYGRAHAVDLVWDLIGAAVDIELLSTDSWIARMLVADTFQRERIYLVGESAHLNPPWGGHGYNTSVGDAVNIAWKIAAVERGWGSPGLLLSYEAERRRVVEQTVSSAATNMRSLAGDLRSDAQAIRDAKLAEFHSLGLVLGYSYAGSPVIQHGPVPAGEDTITYIPSTDPGSRLPHRWMPDGSSLFDHLGRGMSLIGPVGRYRGAVMELQARARARGIPLAVIESPAGYPWADEFLLVRPDQHIAWRAADPSDIDLSVVTGHRTATSAGALPRWATSAPRPHSGTV